MLYKHLKTGSLYRVLHFALDRTNSRDGTGVVVYCPADNRDAVYVREVKEFEAKFERVAS